MLKRAATAVVLGPLVVWTVWKGPGWLVAVLVGLVTVGALWEFFEIAKKIGFNGNRIWVAICAILQLFHQSSFPLDFDSTSGFWGAVGKDLASIGRELETQMVLVVFVLGTALCTILRRGPEKQALSYTGTTVMGFLMIAYPLSILVQFGGHQEVGRKLLLFVLAIVWAGDILGYLVGKGIGRHAMAPGISPNKTWEGAAANFVGSVAVAWPFAKWMGVEWLPLLVLAGLANVAGQIGDLVESAYKRSAGVKDSGTILPGHGGILDRVDALIFATPVVWLYVVLWLG